MEAIRAFLESQAILTLFLVIGFGYALGEINLRGLSFGVGAVLFVGLVVGIIAPAAAPPPVLQSVGLVLFFYGIGIQYGRQFFTGLVSPSGVRQNLLAVVSLAVGVLVALGLFFAGTTVDYVTGQFAGALVSTGALQAALEATGSTNPSIGYSVSYPLGVFAPILVIYVALRLVRPALLPPEGAGYTTLELDVRRPEVIGQTVAEVARRLPEGVQIAAIQRQGINTIPQPSTRFVAGDDVLVIGPANAVEGAREVFGPVIEPVILEHPQGLEYLRVFVSRPAVVGRTIAELRISEALGASVVNVRRGDAELHARPSLALETGDRIGLMTQRSNFAAVRAFFGNSMRSTAEVSYVSLGIGVVLGVLLGLIAVPVPGLGKISLGLAGGPLLVALILGRLRRTGPLTWVLPPTANLVLRTFGLTLFLAVVGMRSGPAFAQTIQTQGLALLLGGLAVTLAVVVTAIVLGHFVVRMPFDELLGVAAGVTGNPAILAFASKSVPTDKPDVGYAITFPSMTIVKILIVQVLAAVFRP